MSRIAARTSKRGSSRVRKKRISILLAALLVISFVAAFPLRSAYADGTGASSSESVQTNSAWTVSVSVRKIWFGTPAESVTISLLANGVSTGETRTLNSSNEWIATFGDLPKYDDYGNEIQYSVSETGYDVNDSSEYSAEVVNDGDGFFTITNIQTVDVSGTVVWDDSEDQDGLRPEAVAVNLLRDGTVVETTTVAAGGDGTWSFSFEDQPLYDSTDASAYGYTVEVADVPDGYSSVVSGDIASGFTITNTHEPETVSVSVKKEWVGDAAGPVTVHLLANGTDTGKTLVLTADDGWAGSFDDLARYSAGEEIAYTVSEDSVEGYTSEVTGDAESGYVITNTQATAEATPSEPSANVTPEATPTKEATPKTGDDGTPAGALAAIALGALVMGVSLRRKVSGRSRL
jgi:LPXTG-motif cell wall-anchored protein